MAHRQTYIIIAAFGTRPRIDDATTRASISSERKLRGLPNRNGDVEEGKCLHAQVTPKFTIVSLSARGQVVQIIL